MATDLGIRGAVQVRTEYDDLRDQGLSDREIAHQVLDGDELAEYYRAHGILWGYVPGTPKRHPFAWDGSE